MLRLTSRAMAQLAVQRLLSTQLVLNLSAMAVGFIFDREVLIRFVDLVRSSLLPLADSGGALTTCLILIHLVE
jgi:hypothetical protein